MCFKNIQKNTSSKYKIKQSKSLLFGQSLACLLWFCMCVYVVGGVQEGMHTCVLQRNETGLYHFLTKKEILGEERKTTSTSKLFYLSTGIRLIITFQTPTCTVTWEKQHTNIKTRKPGRFRCQ